MRLTEFCCTLRHSRSSNKQEKDCGKRTTEDWNHTHDPEDPSYFIPNESASHKFINPEEQKKKRKSQGKRKVNQENSETPKKKKRTDPTSEPPIGHVQHL